MSFKRKVHSTQKAKLHPRNRLRRRYDFKILTDCYPDLSKHVRPNTYGDDSIDFFDPEAVKALNKSLLIQYYKIKNWDIPDGYLCPPIPGRADYIHYAADLMASSNKGKIPKGHHISVIDIGVGANCIYPIIGIEEYNWSFIGSDIDLVALKSAEKIMNSNPVLKRNIKLVHQKNSNWIFQGIIEKEELYDLTICNPPFYSSLEESQESNLRKLSKLNRKKITTPLKNFGGTNSELWCEGGEEKFIKTIIRESKLKGSSCFWFTTLVSKETLLPIIYNELKNVAVTDLKTMEMGQGNKTSRIVCWTFLSPKQQKVWADTRW